MIVLTFNQRELTLRFLESLYESGPGPTHVLVWDNGSSDGTVEAVRKGFPEVLAHRSDANLGVASGRNAGAALAIETWAPDFLLFLDNDMELETGFVTELLDVLRSDSKVGQVQAKLRFMHDRERLNDGGGCRINFLTGDTVPVGIDEVDRGQHDQVKPCIACGGAMMVRTELFESLGGFDGTFDPFGPEDLDFSLRLKERGFEALFVPTAVAYHIVSHTYGAGYSADYARHKARHWVTFLSRHGTWYQKAGFYLVGAPYVALRLVLREGRRGNLGAVKGVLRGLADRVLRRP
ncbi:MAG: glycosyltransferase family 2 protein [Gemmatimonadota bacterium]